MYTCKEMYVKDIYIWKFNFIQTYSVHATCTVY